MRHVLPEEAETKVEVKQQARRVKKKAQVAHARRKRVHVVQVRKRKVEKGAKVNWSRIVKESRQQEVAQKVQCETMQLTVNLFEFLEHVRLAGGGEQEEEQEGKEEQGGKAGEVVPNEVAMEG